LEPGATVTGDSTVKTILGANGISAYTETYTCASAVLSKLQAVNMKEKNKIKNALVFMTSILLRVKRFLYHLDG
jgi:3-oxoacyl-[acyl-carrier-protein] synthase III